MSTTDPTITTALPTQADAEKAAADAATAAAERAAKQNAADLLAWNDYVRAREERRHYDALEMRRTNDAGIERGRRLADAMTPAPAVDPNPFTTARANIEAFRQGGEK